jgi:predicted ribosome-associated RNA-binding protein Tma20
MRCVERTVEWCGSDDCGSYVLKVPGLTLPDTPPAGGAEVVVNRLAGEAVLQGAHVFAPGLLAASSGLAAGDLVAVTVTVEQPGR